MGAQNFKVKSSEKQPVRAGTKGAGAACTAITPSANSAEEQS